ncbi:coatomer subunit alpha-2 [Auriculariales sp. MPI-PUGE-AT-0066]|nr:coatomer subunit alpha-2 [Auriculariales sp. MPI-PUGE-AT-0066]
MQMLTKFESKSNRVKGLAFHPTRPLLASSLHNGSVQLWNYQMGTLVDRFDEHDGPVRAVAFHPSRPLLVSGGDDYKIKVWDIKPQNRRCLFTLHGHLDYVRTVQFHHEMPWIVSASDDQTIRIWNSTSRTCVAILTGHSHYVMSAFFHPKENLIVSASMDQTVRVWDISSLRRSTPNTAPGTFDTFDTFSTVKWVLEGHDRGVNWASFHPTLPLIVSAADDRQIKLWRMSETKAWEVDACRGHFNNPYAALFHPKHELILSAGEDKTIRVWDMSKRTAVQTFRREHDRFWALTAHPELNLFAAGHDSGLIVFKLERERPAFAVHQDTLYYIRDKYVRQCDLSTGADVGALSVRKLGGQWTQPRALSFNPAERSVVVTTASDGGAYELVTLPKDLGAELRDSTADGKRGTGNTAIFVARNRVAILNKATQQIEIRDLTNTINKSFKSPVAAIEIFYGGAGNLLISSATTVVLYDIQQNKNTGEVTAPGVKYAVWSADSSMVALLSKHTIILANKTLSQSSIIHETIRIKSGAWDDTGVFVYSTLNHIKYALPNGDNGIIRTLDQPVYLTRIKGKTIHCLDRSARPRTITVDSTEYRFKLALVRNNYDEVLQIIKTSNLVGQSIIAYLQKKGFPEIALHFVQDKNTRFDLALECGNLEVALEMARAIGRPDCWSRLAQQALKQGDHKIVEKAYQQTKNFDKLSFLYLTIGASDKLAKMQKIADTRGDSMSKFHNALYVGDVHSRINVLRETGLYPLAYLTAVTNGLTDVAQDILDAAGLTQEDLQDLPNFPSSSLGPPPVIAPAASQLVWPAVAAAENFFEKALVNGGLEDADAGAAYVNGDAREAALDDWANEEAAEEDEAEVDAGWDLDVEGPEATFDEAAGELAVDSSDAGPSASHGISETDLWVRNSPFATDHVAAGAFESAMQLLNNQSGIVNFEPLKPHFMEIYRLQLHVRRNPDRDAPGQVLPITVKTLASVRNEIKEGTRALQANQLPEAQTALRAALRSALFVTVANDDEAKEWRDVITTAREYLIGITVEIARRKVVENEPDNVQRSLELAAYFTHCQMQPAHLQLALRNAMNVFQKANNHKTAARFAGRLIELNPDPKVVAKARQVVAAGQRNPRNAIDIAYDETAEFDICAATFVPIYKGQPAVHCPYTGATYVPECKGQLDPLSQLAEIGAPTAGLPAPRA